MAWFGRKKEKDKKDAISEAENMVNDISQRVREAQNLPGMQRASHTASKQASDMMRSIEMRNFENKFKSLGYKEISHELNLQRLGIKKDDAFLKPAALSMLQDVESSCVMSDFLLPYLLEKEKVGILNERELSQLNEIRFRMSADQFRKVSGGTAMLIGMLLGDEELAKRFEVAYGLYIDYLVEQKVAQDNAQQEVSITGRRSK